MSVPSYSTVPSSSSSSGSSSFNDFRAREDQLRFIDQQINAKKFDVLKRAEELKQQAEMLVREQETKKRDSSTMPYSPSRNRPKSAAESPHQHQHQQRAALVERESNENEIDNEFSSKLKFDPAQSNNRSATARPATANSIRSPSASASAANAAAAQPIHSPRNQTTNNQLKSSSSAAADDANSFDPLSIPTSSLSSAATIRYQKARILALTDHIEKQNSIQESLDKENSKYKSELNDMKIQLEKYKKSSILYESNLSKEKSHNENLLKSIQLNEKQINSLNHNNELYEKKYKELENEYNKKELKYNRIQIELEKYKSNISKLSNQSTNNTELLRIQNQQYERENKKLLSNRNELLNVLKKQMKLIEILRKQKLHMEAAKMLQFSEEEFMKALEAGEM